VIMDAGYFTGRIQAAIACEAIRRAAEAVGPENVDNVSVKAGLDSMKNVDFEGLTTITYTPEERRGFTKTRIYAVKNGKIVRLTDWTESPKLVP